MNKFALTTIAALPGSGGGNVAALQPEVNKPRPPKRTFVLDVKKDMREFDEYMERRGKIDKQVRHLGHYSAGTEAYMKYVAAQEAIQRGFKAAAVAMRKSEAFARVHAVDTVKLDRAEMAYNEFSEF